MRICLFSEAILEVSPFGSGYKCNRERILSRNPLYSLWKPRFSWKHQIYGIASTCFLFVHTSALDRSDVPASSMKVDCCVLKKKVQEVLEDALGAPASSYESLLLSAGKCRQSPKEWICRVLCLCLCTYTIRSSVWKWTFVHSPSKHCCRNWSPSRAAGISQQPLPASLPLTSQPLPPHMGTGYLHLTPWHLQLPSPQFVMNLCWFLNTVACAMTDVRDKTTMHPQPQISVWMGRDPSHHLIPSCSLLSLVASLWHSAALHSADLRKALTIFGCNSAKPQVRKPQSHRIWETTRPWSLWENSSCTPERTDPTAWHWAGPSVSKEWHISFWCAPSCASHYDFQVADKATGV